MKPLLLSIILTGLAILSFAQKVITGKVISGNDQLPLYSNIGDKIWGECGFTDAFSVSNGYYGTSFLAIDQGPIFIMIENYRTQLC